MVKKFFAYPLLIAIIAAIPYLAFINQGFSYRDDIKFIHDTNLYGWSAVFMRDHSGYLRPLVNLWWLLPQELGLGSAVSRHIIGAFFGSITAIVLFFVLLQLGLSRRSAIIGTLIFALNPATYGMWSWLTAQGGYLPIVLLLLLSFLLYLRGKVLWSLLCFALGFADSQTIIILPILLLTYELYQQGNWRKTVPYFGVSMIYILAQFFFIRDSMHTAALHPGYEYYAIHPLRNFHALISGFGGLLLPWLIPQWRGPESYILQSPRHLLFPAGFVSLTIMIYLFVCFPKTRFGLLWTLITLAPMVGAAGGYFIASRHYLLPMIGLAISICSLSMESFLSPRWHRLFLLATGQFDHRRSSPQVSAAESQSS